ncbi:MAG TPA: M48 family metallopeptidase [Polyangium sp.]|nr:M48 family metallopeptidase [Polyangium sp.]
MPGEEVRTANSSTQQGFGHSPQRVVAEIGIVLLALLLLIFGARGCAGFAAEPIVAALSPDVDAAIGKAGGESIRKQHSVQGAEPTAEEKARVDRVFEELRSGLTTDEKRILVAPRVTVLKDEQVNAFALPGGEMFVLTGLLERTKGDDAELRGVLAHEIGHAVKRHGVRSLVRNGIFGLVIIFVTGDLNDITTTLIAGASQLDSLSYSRSMEEEADAFGVDLLARCHEDPEGLARFLESLEKQPVPEFLSTHPDSAERAKAIRERMKK